MKIEFVLDDFDDILDDNEDLFEDITPTWIEADEGCLLRIDGFRVVIPEINVSFRTGELYFRNEEIEDPDDPDAWDFAHSADILYEKDEVDPSNFLEYTTGYLPWLFEEACKKANVSPKDVGSVKCYIETDEFIDESEL